MTSTKVRILVWTSLALAATAACAPSDVPARQRDAEPGLTAQGPAAGGSAKEVPPSPADFTATPLEISAAADTPTLLTRVDADASGVSHQNYLPRDRQGQYLYLGAGAAAGDYDNDGLVDLYLVSEAGPSHLYKNLGDWQFRDVTEEAQVALDHAAVAPWDGRYPTGAAFGDIDADGDLDLYVTALAGAATMFENEGDGTFTDITEAAGVGYVGASTTSAFSDYDRDGDLDLYVATYRPYGTTKFFPPGSHGTPEPELNYDMSTAVLGMGLVPEADHLYRNDGTGTFTDVAVAAGVGTQLDWGLAASFADVDNDGWPDLYVANDFQTPDRFYHNRGDGTFEEFDRSRFRHTSYFSMGMDFGDVNNDGLVDFMTTDMMSPDRARRQIQHMDDEMMTGKPPPGSAAQLMRNGLMLNMGGGYFGDVAPFAGVTATDWTWSVKLADLDLDGLLDLIGTNGFVNDAMNADHAAKVRKLRSDGDWATALEEEFTRPRLLTPNFAYRNVGGLRFEDTAKTWGFDDTAVTNGMTVADLDNDGDLDVATNAMNAPAGIFRNEASANRLKIALKGRASNTHGLGARITLEIAGAEQTREMRSSGGYMSSHESVVVFGMGDADQADRLLVTWPSGLQSVMTDVAANQALVITEPDGEPPVPTTVPEPETQFAEVASILGVDFVHRDKVADDFREQPLLPFRLSQFGPGVAWGDADGDGYDDLYVAGGSGEPGVLFLNTGGAGFERSVTVPEVPEGTEEQAALLWPREGGADLLTSLSSVELREPGPHPVAALRAQDDGKSVWRAESEGSGSALAAADYNGDGWLDLFVGSRGTPNQYPMPAPSQLLKGGRDGLEEDRANVAALRRVGLVTGALWADVDGDVDPDLVTATEWGPVRLFENDGGVLSDASETAGLAQLTGLWSGLASGDVDHDGDMDLVATNAGLNTNYRASEAEPLVLYGGDMDGDGDFDLVETEWDAGVLYPLRNRLDLSGDISGAWERFSSWQEYAHATVEEAVGPEELNRGTRFEVVRLEHTLFVNDGEGGFTAMALPQEAQLMVGYGVVLADLDDDGHDDIYMVGNFYGPEPMHTGQYDAGLGVLLRGDGSGAFEAVSVQESGLAVPADAKGLAETDFDQDGWVDLAVGVNSGAVMLFKNAGVNGRQGLAVRLLGPVGNPAGVGAQIEVTRADGLKITREVQLGSSFWSANGTVEVFGLGDDPAAASVTVQWPDGTTQTDEDAAPGTLVEFEHAG